MGCNRHFKKICEFQDSDSLKNKSLSLDFKDHPEFTEMLKDLDMQDHFIFDFYPITIDE